jgi:hypothetical protein
MSRCLKVIGFLSLVLLISVFLTACPTSSGGGGATITTAQATTAVQTVVGAVSLMMNSKWTETGISSPYTESYSTTGLVMTGTKTVVGSNNNYVLTITLLNYSDAATGYTVNGTINFSMNGGATTTGTVTGDVTLSGGPVTKETWNISITSTGGAPAYTGTITCNDTPFDGSTLSISGTNMALSAAHVVGDGLGAVMNASSLWGAATGPVSYSSPTGLWSVTGTATIGSTDTYVLTITLSNYASSPYTVSGTCNFSLTGSAGAITSGTLTGTFIFSGGPVTTQTWNVSNISGTITPSFQISGATGTITSNGTAFDAKTFF